MDQASLSLDSLPPANSRCPHCGQSGQSVSHGYFYKQNAMGCREVAGKRILCSHRHGKRGCGRTRQWYLADIVPDRRYRLSVFIAFIRALLGGDRVEPAYLNATGFPSKEPRQAWRWLGDFLKQLPRWRTQLCRHAETLTVTQTSSALNLLLPTLGALSDQLGQLNYVQVHYQHRFC